MKQGEERKLFMRMMRYPSRILPLYIAGMIGFAGQDMFAVIFMAMFQRRAIDLAVSNTSVADVVAVLLIYAVAYVLLYLIMFLLLTVFDYCLLRIENMIKGDFMRAVLRHTEFRTGSGENLADIKTRILRDTNAVSFFTTHQVGLFLIPICKMIGCAVMLIILNPKSFLYVPVFCVLPFIYSALLAAKSRKLQISLRASQTSLQRRVEEVVKNIEVIKGYEAESVFSKRIYAVIKELKCLRMTRIYIDAGKVFLENTLNVILLLISLAQACYMYSSGTLPLSTVLILPVLTAGMLSGAEAVSTVGLSWQQTRVSAERVFSVIDEEESKNSHIDSGAETASGEGVGDISFSHVSFHYNEINGVTDINAVFPKRKISCICGGIGSGKSTLLKLLLGLEIKTEGKITIGSFEQGCVSEEAWTGLFACVSQPARLLSGTIRENIMLGNREDEKRLKYVLHLTGLEKVINRFPQGMDTDVLDESANLSGGEKQLICFARAVFSPAPILVLDEFSSDFDITHDALAIRALKQMVSSNAIIAKTVLMVTHKEEFVQCADVVYEMRSDGRITHLESRRV